MKIKNKLYSLAALALFMAAIQTSIVVYTSKLSQQETQQYQLARLIHNITLSMNKSINDYLITHNQNNQRRWLDKSTSLTSYLNKLKELSSDKSKIKIVALIQKENSAIEKVFQKIIINEADISNDEANNVDHIHIRNDKSLNDFLTSTMLISMQHVSTYSDKLSTISFNESQQQQQQSKQLILIFMGIFITLVVITLFTLAKNISSPLRTLTAGTREISKGNLDFSFELDSNDEIGNLADAFNVMSQSLKVSKEETEKSAKAKSEFLACMSHEIRTPMNGVLGMLTLLNNSSLNSDQSHHLKLATSSANSLLTIINDILDFSKIEAGKLELEAIPFNLVSLVTGIAKTLAFHAHEKGLEIALKIKSESSPFIVGDPTRVRQILVNLVNNAIKFTDKGTVIIAVSQIIKSSDTALLQLSITDTGIGIEKSRQKNLFTSFTQMDSSNTREFGGTGLGLTIVQMLCNLMNGSIEIESDLDKGSKFTANLLLKPSTETVGEAKEIVTKSKNIMVVENNLCSLEAISEQLSSWGHNVTTISHIENISSFHDMLNTYQKSSPFDMIFINISMPNIEVEPLIHCFKVHPHFALTKLTVMTPPNFTYNNSALAKLNLCYNFNKPASIEDLSHALFLIDEQEETLTEYENNKAVQPQEEATPHAFKNIRILIVEDNRTNQMVARGLLDKLGISCDVASDGLDALEMLKNSSESDPFTVILMDCQMPKMDGYEASEKIRAGYAGERYLSIFIIALTANAMLGDKDKCIDAGMNEYLAKPIDSERLTTLLTSFDQRNNV